MWPTCRQYPKHIYVRGTQWDIKFCRKTPDTYPGEGVGLCDPETKTIYIKYKQPPRETFLTFIHELLHAIEDEYEVEIGHPIIEPLEYAVANLLENNAEIIIHFVFLMFGVKPVK